MLPAQPTLQFAGDLGIQPVRILLKGSGSVVLGSAATAGNSAGSIQTSSFGGSYASTQIILEKPTDVARNGIDTLLDAAFDSAGIRRRKAPYPPARQVEGFALRSNHVTVGSTLSAARNQSILRASPRLSNRTDPASLIALWECPHAAAAETCF
jgi:hypothetical protein